MDLKEWNKKKGFIYRCPNGNVETRRHHMEQNPTFGTHVEIWIRLSQGGLSIIKDLVFSMAEGDLLQIYLQFLSASFISDNIM